MRPVNFRDELSRFEMMIRSWNGTTRAGEISITREMERKKTRWLVSRLIISSRLKYERRVYERGRFSFLSFRFEPRDRIINTLIRDSFVFSTHPFPPYFYLFPSSNPHGKRNDRRKENSSRLSFPLFACVRFPFVIPRLYYTRGFLYTLEFIGLVAMYRGEKERERSFPDSEFITREESPEEESNLHQYRPSKPNKRFHFYPVSRLFLFNLI